MTILNVYSVSSRGDRDFISQCSVDDLVNQASDCCSDDEIAEIVADIEAGRIAKMDAGLGAWFEYHRA